MVIAEEAVNQSPLLLDLVRSGSTMAVPPSVLATPSWTWTAPNNQLVRSSPIVDAEGAIYVSTSAGELFKFSREGRQLWKRSFNHHVFANPMYFENIYTLRDDCTFFALDAATGKTLWQKRAGHGSGPDTLTVIAACGLLGNCFQFFGYYDFSNKQQKKDDFLLGLKVQYRLPWM